MSISLPQIVDGGRNVLTHSARSAFRECPRRYFLSYVRGWRKRKGSEALKADYVARNPQAAGTPGLPDGGAGSRATEPVAAAE